MSPEIIPLIATLAAGRPPEAGCCRNWTRAHVEVVRFHQLAPWLYFRLRDYHEAGLAADHLLSMEKDYGLSAIMSRVRAQSLQKVLEAFERSSLPVVLLKGAYLAQTVYEDPGLRTMCDVDVLTHEGDFERASNVLKGLGYVIAVEALYKDEVLPPPAMAYTRPGLAIDSIDLHRALWGIDYYRLDPSILWEHMTQKILYGHRVSFLTPELNFIHLALHTLNHSYLLRDWLDLALLSNDTPLDWDRLIDLAQALQVSRPLFWAVEELRRFWALSVPDRAVDRLSSYVPHWLEDRVISGRFRYGWRLYAKLTLLNGWGSRLTYASSKVFPPKTYREAFSGNSRLASYWGARLRHVALRITSR